ncbi:MAG TPA: hypothetical protein VJ654_06015 [Noviherbaspirillum sp.]|nr:hypothetical protein [Noviherbaspirillum sp.]
MNTRSGDKSDAQQGKDEGALEKLANLIDPSGRKISDEELSDPGSNTPDSKPEENRATPKPPIKNNH